MAEKEMIVKLGADADLQVFEKYRDLMNEVLGTYEENIKSLQIIDQEIKKYKGAVDELNKTEEKHRALSKEEEEDRILAIKTVRGLKNSKSDLLQVIKEQEKYLRAENEEYKRTNSTVNLLSQTFRKMNKEQSAANKDLAGDIDKLRNALKEADASIGNFQRNVGNYPKMLQQVTAQIPGLNNLTKHIGTLNKAFQSMGASATTAGASSSALVSAMAAAGPAIAILGVAIGAMVVQYNNFSDAVNSSASLTYAYKDATVEADAASAAMTSTIQRNAAGFIQFKAAIVNTWTSVKTFASLNWAIIFEQITQGALSAAKAIKGIGLSVAAIVTGDWDSVKQAFAESATAYLNMTTARDRFLSTFGDEEKRQAALQAKINAKQKEYDDARIASKTKLAKLDKDIAEQRLISMDSENYSREQQIAAIEKAQELTKKKYAEEKKVQRLYAELLELQGQQTDNAVEFNEKIKESAAALIRLDAAEDNALRTLSRRLNALRNQESADEKRKERDRQKAQKDAEKRAKQDAKAQAEAEKARAAAANQIDKWAIATEKAQVAMMPSATHQQKIKKDIAEVTAWYKEQTEKLEQEYDKQEAALEKHGEDTEDLFVAFVGRNEALREEYLYRLGNAERGGTQDNPLAKFFGVTDEEFEQIKSQALQFAQQLYSQVEQMARESIQRRLDDELDALDRETDSKKAALKKQADDGVISQKTYERRLEEIDKEAAERQEELKKEAFEKEKKLNIITAAMNGAMAITNIWAHNAGKPVTAAILTAMSAIMLATQIGIISAQKYARGGLLQGASHAQGGIKGNVQGNNIELEGGEVVINKRSAAMFRRELSAINSYNGWGQKFAEGGELPKRFKFAEGGRLPSFAPAPLPTNADNGIASIMNAINKRNDNLERAISAIERQVVNIRAHVVYDEIESTGNDIRLSVERAAL